tara:strand:- start:286 stop:486 length:201 start_codon:yes stop_codon:yes gene_type:complete
MDGMTSIVNNFSVTIQSTKEGIMKKVRGSFQMSEETKKAISEKAKSENRTFNNMLEELAKRALNFK